jgi:hypothetical protein
MLRSFHELECELDGNHRSLRGVVNPHHIRRSGFLCDKPMFLASSFGHRRICSVRSRAHLSDSVGNRRNGHRSLWRRQSGENVTPEQLVIPPPTPKMFDYPGAVGVAFLIVFTTVMLFVAGKYDPSGGVLSLSLLVVLAFIGVVVFCLFFTVPRDETTAAIIGGLTAAFGAVIAHWLSRRRDQ